MKENQEYIRKRRPVNFTLADLEEEDEEFDYQNFDPMPSTSRALPSRICKKKILYDDKSSSDEEPDEDVAAEEPNFSDGKNYIHIEGKKQPEPDEYYEEDSEEDPDPYGIWRQDYTSSDSD